VIVKNKAEMINPEKVNEIKINKWILFSREARVP
jgi:hypothetical protein